jgi:ubiquinone/menaquinone biosynthesis C-methylase UbiE
MKTIDQYDELVVASGFDAVADRYGEVAFLRRSAQALVDTLPAATIVEALDIATGPGTAAILLAERFSSARVIGIDISPEMVGIARARTDSMNRQNVEFLVGSAVSLPFEDARFDLVVCTNAIYYMTDFAHAVAEWARVLRPGARLSFSTFSVGMLEPMASLFDARVQAHGIVVPRPTPLYRLTSATACRRLSCCPRVPTSSRSGPLCRDRLCPRRPRRIPRRERVHHGRVRGRVGRGVLLWRVVPYAEHGAPPPRAQVS